MSCNVYTIFYSSTIDLKAIVVCILVHELDDITAGNGTMSLRGRRNGSLFMEMKTT